MSSHDSGEGEYRGILDEWAQEQTAARDRSAEQWDNEERGQKVTDEEIAAIRARAEQLIATDYYDPVELLTDLLVSQAEVERLRARERSHAFADSPQAQAAIEREHARFMAEHAQMARENAALRQDVPDLLAFAEAALPILRAVAACEAVRSPTFDLGGIEGIALHHDSLNVLWMREQARALLAGKGEEHGA